MPRLCIKCPSTGKSIPTEHQYSERVFQMADLDGSFTSCPHCGQMHRWDKKDAYFEAKTSVVPGIDKGEIPDIDEGVIPGVREHSEGYPVELLYNESVGRWVLRARNKGGSNETLIDFWDLFNKLGGTNNARR